MPFIVSPELDYLTSDCTCVTVRCVHFTGECAISKLEVLFDVSIASFDLDETTAIG